MRSPQLLFMEYDGWIAKQLRELAGENRWLLQSARSVDTALSLGAPPTDGVVRAVRAGRRQTGALQLITDVQRFAPDTPIVAIADVKLPDAERAAWTAALFDLGRCVLFPPLTKPVLEDVASGLMTATIRRVVGETPPAIAPKPAREHVLDLADEGADA